MGEEALKQYFEPTNVGPGVWFAFHQIAMSAENYQIQTSYVENFITILCMRFPCLECRGHMRNMFNIHNFDNKGPFGLFSYSYMIHDKVNRRLGKTSPPASVIRKAYYGDGSNVIDKNKLGPGIWWVMHTLAQQSPDMLSQFISMIIGSQILKGWTHHLYDFLITVRDNNIPPSQKPFAVWSFHNKINEYLGKDKIAYEPVYNFFKNDEGCGNCGHGGGAEGFGSHLLSKNMPIYFMPT